MEPGKAEQLIADADLNWLLDKVERAAIEAVLSASRDDEHARRDQALKANTIRDIRRELKRLAAVEANPVLKRA